MGGKLGDACDHVAKHDSYQRDNDGVTNMMCWMPCSRRHVQLWLRASTPSSDADSRAAAVFLSTGAYTNISDVILTQACL